MVDRLVPEFAEAKRDIGHIKESVDKILPVIEKLDDEYVGRSHTADARKWWLTVAVGIASIIGVCGGIAALILAT